MLLKSSQPHGCIANGGQRNDCSIVSRRINIVPQIRQGASSFTVCLGEDLFVLADSRAMLSHPSLFYGVSRTCCEKASKLRTPNLALD